MEAAAPQQVVVVQAAGRNALPKVIGIIAIVFASIGILWNVLIGGLIAVLMSGAEELGAEVSFMETWGFMIFTLPASIMLLTGGIKCVKYQKMGVFIMLGAEVFSIIGNLVIGNAVGDMDVVSSMTFPLIFAVVWALPLLLAKDDLQ